MRLQQYLSQAGIWSRREAEKHIVNSAVRVNGEIVTELGTKVGASDVVEYHLPGSTAWKKASVDANRIVYALYKPTGFTSTTKDPHAEHTVLELVPDEPHVYPIGRLDQDSEGLLLLTNDGDLTHQLTHPGKHVSKTYRVTCNIPPTYTLSALPESLAKLENGIMLDDEQTAPLKISIITPATKQSLVTVLQITMHEGKNRQIRRMMQKIGLHVVQLVRIRIGKLNLDELKLEVGKYTILSQPQIKKLLT